MYREVLPPIGEIGARQGGVLSGQNFSLLPRVELLSVFNFYARILCNIISPFPKTSLLLGAS